MIAIALFLFKRNKNEFDCKVKNISDCINKSLKKLDYSSINFDKSYFSIIADGTILLEQDKQQYSITQVFDKYKDDLQGFIFVDSMAIGKKGGILVVSSSSTSKVWCLKTQQFICCLEIFYKPILTQIFVVPEKAVLEFNQSQQFTIRAVDQFNTDMSVSSINWEAKKGKISKNGLFTAGQTKGRFAIIATVEQKKCSSLCCNQRGC
ncbi:MAG: hypothetical protein LRZ84_23710 [Desertifilum sp.]|nr:hypothetical protein [Desertifilum sp.]